MDEYDTFMRKLDSRIKSHDKDIERMCNAHYQGFVDCIHELLQVRPQAERLKKDIMSSNADLMKSADNVQRKADELIRHRRILCSAESAIEHLTMCLPVLEMYSKLVTQMQERKYYPALKTLETLECNLLPRVSKYRFAQTMCVKIPRMREQIKDASMSDLKDFLENVRKLSVKIGEVALKNIARQQNLDEEYYEVITGSSPRKQSGTAGSPFRRNSGSNKQIINMIPNGSSTQGQQQQQQPAKSRKKGRAPPPPNPFTGEIDAYSSPKDSSPPDSETPSTPSEDEISATDLVDFSPVYRCLHIFSCLGSSEEFESYYRNQREQQERLALQAPHNMYESIDHYRTYFCSIMGFFVIEDHVMSTTTGLVTKEYLDGLWRSAVRTIVSSVRHHLSLCQEEQMMMKIKRAILLLSYAIRSHGFNVDQLYQLMQETRDQFNDLLMRRWSTTFTRIFEMDNFSPIVVDNQSDYEAVLREFPYNPSPADNSPNGSPVQSFPMKFPFSAFVPKVYSEVKKFILCCLQFCRDTNFNHREVEDMIRKSTNILLTRTLGGCLSNLIKKSGLGLLQLIQITINTNHLEDACVHLEDFIAKSIDSQLNAISSSSSSTSAVLMSPPSSSLSSSPPHMAFKLQGRSMFKDARSDAESQIYLQLNHKIDEFLELATYDWLLAESNGMASAYVSDLIAFLKATFSAFTNLPVKVAQTACHSACKHISNSLMNFLMDEEVKAISLGALEQFNLDLIQCELFAASDPVKGSDDGSLLLCFSELRQLMDLFTSEDWSRYFADYGKPDSKYLRVNPQTALNLLEKKNEADKKKNLFTALKKNERDKKKLSDTIAKQLKQLILTNNTS